MTHGVTHGVKVRYGEGIECRCGLLFLTNRGMGQHLCELFGTRSRNGVSR